MSPDDCQCMSDVAHERAALEGRCVHITGISTETARQLVAIEEVLLYSRRAQHPNLYAVSSVAQEGPRVVGRIDLIDGKTIVKSDALAMRVDEGGPERATRLVLRGLMLSALADAAERVKVARGDGSLAPLGAMLAATP